MPTIRTNGIAMYYEAAGQGVPLLLLHGLGSGSEDWEYQLSFFSHHYRVIAADMRGHGRSEKPPGPYSVSMMAVDVTGLLDELSVGEAHIVGLSMGGMIAFQLAVGCPERVRSLVIVNSAPALVPHTIGEWVRVRQRLMLARLFGPARTGRFLSRRLFPKPDQEFFRTRLIERWATNDSNAYLASMHALIGWSVEDRVGDLCQPVLVIVGDRDYTSVDSKRAYACKIPDARVVVFEDSGHATPIDQADRFNNCVLDYLHEVDANHLDGNGTRVKR